MEQTPLLSRGGESRGCKASTGVVLIKKIHLLTYTTPALRATPPLLRRGACSFARPSPRFARSLFRFIATRSGTTSAG